MDKNSVQITTDTKPEDIPALAKTVSEALTKAKLPFVLEDLERDMKGRAAALHGVSVEQWEAMFQPLPPVPDVPKVKKTPENTRKQLRGAAAKIDPDYFWVSDENLAIVDTWVALRRDMGVVMNLLTVGPSGCGKTEGVIRAGKDKGIPVYKVDCASITTADRWVGHKELLPGENGMQTQYVLSEHLQWLSADGHEPGIVLYDEINRLHPSLLNMLIPIMDGSQRIWVPDLGIHINVHKDTMIAATMNQGVGYSGTHGLDIALHDRFGVIMEQGFPPEDEEIKVLVNRTGIDEDRAKRLIAVATQCRAKAADGSLSKHLSTRSLIDWARWVTTGMTMTEAAEATWVKKYSNDGGSSSERQVARLVVKGVCAGK